MHDALRKAAEERERRRRSRGATPTKEPPAEPVLPPEHPEESGLPEPAAAPRETLREARRSAADLALPKERRERHAQRMERALERMTQPPPTRREATPPRAARASERSNLATGELDERVILVHQPRDPRSEQIRSLRANLLTLERVPRSILLTSGSPNEGKTLLVVNLAAALAEGGSHEVLLVDGNLRNPGVAELVGGRPAPGLVDLLRGTVVDPFEVIQEIPAISGVSLMAAGELPDSPGGLLVPAALRRVLDRVSDRFSFVIVDSPAMDHYADAAVMAPETDGVLIVVQLEGPARNAAERALDTLSAARSPILGTIVTRSRR
jgi:capsular exopolysaccharide synthesis family protein